MFTNLVILIILAICVILFVAGLIIVFIVAAKRATDKADALIYNPKKLQVVFYYKKSSYSKEYEIIDPEDIYNLSHVTGVAVYGENVISFYLNDTVRKVARELTPFPEEASTEEETASEELEANPANESSEEGTEVEEHQPITEEEAPAVEAESNIEEVKQEEKQPLSEESQEHKNSGAKRRDELGRFIKNS